MRGSGSEMKCDPCFLILISVTTLLVGTSCTVPVGLSETWTEPPVDWVFVKQRMPGEVLPLNKVYLRDETNLRFSVFSGVGPEFRALPASEFATWGLPARARMAALSHMADAGTVLYVTWNGRRASVYERVITQQDGWKPRDRFLASFQPQMIGCGIPRG